MIRASIIICSLDRPKQLQRLLISLEKQTCQDYEIILCRQEGNLVELKDKGWRKAQSDICIWLDDDVECIPSWLEKVLETFKNKEIVGVTGPTVVTDEYLKNRDIFREGLFKKFYNWFFLEDRSKVAGFITPCGAATYGGDYDYSHQGARIVDFLQPSAFAVRTRVMSQVNGFDLNYKGVAEWCDVDLCYRIKEYGKLIFMPSVWAWHMPEKDTTYNKRKDTASRYKNYVRFSNKWVKPSFKNKLYKLFLRIYFFLKGREII